MKQKNTKGRVRQPALLLGDEKLPRGLTSTVRLTQDEWMQVDAVAKEGLIPASRSAALAFLVRIGLKAKGSK
jgi:hypothetical protein